MRIEDNTAFLYLMDPENKHGSTHLLCNVTYAWSTTLKIWCCNFKNMMLQFGRQFKGYSIHCTHHTLSRLIPKTVVLVDSRYHQSDIGWNLTLIWWIAWPGLVVSRLQRLFSYICTTEVSLPEISSENNIYLVLSGYITSVLFLYRGKQLSSSA